MSEQASSYERIVARVRDALVEAESTFRVFHKYNTQVALDEIVRWSLEAVS